MKPFCSLLLLVGAIAVLALVAIAAMFSIRAGYPSWILITIFVVDSFAIMALGVWVMITARRGHR